MSSKYSTLSRSRTYIVVPRNVPPENFLSVPETQKKGKKGLVRCVLIPVLALLMIAGLLSGLGYLVHGYHIHQETAKWRGMEEHVQDDPSAAYEYTELVVDQNTTLYLRTPAPSPCSSSPCLGGGSCESHDGTFTCYCGVGRWGQFCQKVVKRSRRGQLVAQFSGQSYVKLRSVATAGPRTSIRVKMRTSSKDGVILFSSLDSDQNSGNLSLSLVGGHVQFRYHLGEDHLVLQSPYQVTLGSWHNLVLQTYHGDAMLRLDTQESVLGSFQGGRLAGLGSEVVIGGVDQSGGFMGFRGCLKHLKFGHQAVSLVSDVEPLLIEERGVGECVSKELS
jgi:hypothetical protein